MKSILQDEGPAEPELSFWQRVEQRTAERRAQRPEWVKRMASRTRSCVACQGVVSRDAKLCPHCGQSNPGMGERARLVIGVLAVVLTVVLWPYVWAFVQDCGKLLHDLAEIGRRAGY